MATLLEDRLQVLRERLEATGSVVVSEIARDLSVSEMTVRRDLRRLEEQGQVARVHGGAVAGGVLTFSHRLAQHGAAKKAAAQKLADLIPAQGCIFLDGSTTVFHVAELLAKRSGLRAVTCNLDTYLRLQRYPGVEAVLTGGTQDQQTDNFAGPIARLALRHLSFDAAFFSAYAWGANGPAEPSLDDAELKELVAERSAQIGIAINHQKLMQQASGVWHCAPERVVLATDLAPDHPDVQPYASLVSAIR